MTSEAKRGVVDDSASREYKRPRLGELSSAVQESNGGKNLATGFQESHSKVEIKLRSESKAERNDPDACRERIRRLLTSMREASKNKQSEDMSSTSDCPVQKETSQEEGQTSGSAVVEHSQMKEDPSKDTEMAKAERGNAVLNDKEIDCEVEPDQDDFIEDEDPEDEDTDEDDFSGQDNESDSENRSENDEFAEFEWLEVMDGLVSHTRGSPNPTEHKQIGFCDGKLIRREQIRGIFYSSMEEPSEETCLFAFDLFDRYGRLRPEFKKHPVRKGSGVWNEEFDVGDILLIEYLIIDEGHRRQGLGKKLVTAMLETAKKKTEGPFFAAVRPAYLRRVEQEERFQGKSGQELEHLLLQDGKVATDFYRSLGFRRIGSSAWFGLASDPNHPSHSVPSSGDYDPPQPQHAPSDEGLRQILKMEEMGDSHVFDLLEQFHQKCPDTDPRWLTTDERGNTLLHSVAINSKPRSLDWILARAFGSQMQDTRNDNGDTPLDALLFQLEKTRTRKYFGWSRVVHLSDCFEGYSEASVHCVARLKRLTEASPLVLLQLTFGCTCGQCHSGFLSPRMIFYLHTVAEASHDSLLDQELESGQVWALFHEEYLYYLPDAVRENLKTNKSMRKGFANIFDHIATCLKAKILPTEANVLAAHRDAKTWPPCTSSFLKRGGTVGCAASALFERAMNRDELAGVRDDESVVDDRLLLLPECRNDNEFAFVSGMCGYERVSRIRYKGLSEQGRGMTEADFYRGPIR